MKLEACMFDYGRSIGIALEENGVRKTVRIANPFHEFQRRDDVEGAADQRAF